MKHKILPSGLHAITINNKVHIYTEEEWQHFNWWNLVKLKYNL